MSGISRIQSARENRGQGNAPSSVPGREVWFKDGDQAFITALATGEEGDPFLDEVYMYTYNSGSRWVNLVDDPSVDASDVPANTRPSHKFALWAYVHEIIHTERRNDEWEVVNGPGGRKMFKETVNDFRIISLTESHFVAYFLRPKFGFSMPNGFKCGSSKFQVRMPNRLLPSTANLLVPHPDSMPAIAMIIDVGTLLALSVVKFKYSTHL